MGGRPRIYPRIPNETSCFGFECFSFCLRLLAFTHLSALSTLNVSALSKPFLIKKRKGPRSGGFTYKRFFSIWPNGQKNADMRFFGQKWDVPSTTFMCTTLKHRTCTRHSTRNALCKILSTITVAKSSGHWHSDILYWQRAIIFRLSTQENLAFILAFFVTFKMRHQILLILTNFN